MTILFSLLKFIWVIHEQQFANDKITAVLSHGFIEDVHKLKIESQIWKSENRMLQASRCSRIEGCPFNMYNASMKYRIVSNLNYTSIVPNKKGVFSRIHCPYMRPQIQRISKHDDDIAWYPAMIDNLKTRYAIWISKRPKNHQGQYSSW